tara:strand:- start:5518 stop:6807 length:1290 start_codon:yes stop_codon:yes gene_type:complete
MVFQGRHEKMFLNVALTKFFWSKTMMINKHSLRALLTVALLVSPLVSRAQTDNWESWLFSQIMKHPNAMAAKEQSAALQSAAEANEQPLYNPEFSLGADRTGSTNNFEAGLSQTIDWSNQKESLQSKAVAMRISAEAELNETILERTSESLVALVAWRASKQEAEIAESQQERLNVLFELVEQRQKAGDIGRADAELLFLSLSEQLSEVAQANASIDMVEARVRELLPDWTPQRGGVPDSFWSSFESTFGGSDLLAHPAIVAAQARWQVLQAEAEATSRRTKASPTVGLVGGRDGGENVVGLTFSIPLNVRNNYSAQNRAAGQLALEAEARFQALYRKKKYELEGTRAAWQRYEQQLSRWQELSSGRVQRSADLLGEQWKVGDISTSGYLQALGQRADSLKTGIELERQTQFSLIELLRQSGELTAPFQ